MRDARKSASTTTTVLPASARVTARSQVSVDLPSPGMELVMTIVWAGWSTSTNWRLVRIRRSDSARAEEAYGYVITGRAAAPGSTATVPSDGADTSSWSI